MAALPTPLPARRNLPRSGEAGWIVAPGPVPAPAVPAGLGDAGRSWWEAAWASPVSGLWERADVEQVGRGARLAQVCAGTSAKAALLVELRRLEDGLGLTRAGRLRLRISMAGDAARRHPDSSAATVGDLEKARERQRARRKRIQEGNANA